MKVQSSAIVRTVASATLVAALTLGAHAFVPAAFGCSAQSGGASCKKASTDSTPVVGWLSDVRLLVNLFDLFLP
jgi:hypothetical protein